MMIEGSVEVFGSVAIDRTKEVENILLNAKRCFEDGNYSEASSLFTQVLSIDADNLYAIMYRGIASARLSTTNNDHIDEALNSFSRALQMKHQESGDCEEFWLFGGLCE